MSTGVVGQMVRSSSYEAVMAAAARYEARSTPSDATAAPRRHLAVVACMDARLDLFSTLGLEVGDAHLIRNAGGRATDDVLRSLALSGHALGTREVVVIHHTQCGLHQATNPGLQALVNGATGADVSHVDFLPFDDVDHSVSEDVERIATCPYLHPDLVVWGAVFEVEKVRLRLVVPPRGKGQIS